MNKNATQAESEEERKKRIALEKAKLDEQLANGLITGVEYNKRVIDLVIPEEEKKKPKAPLKTSTLIIVIVLLILCAIPAAIFLNWHFYFQNTLVADLPDYSEDLKSSIETSPIQINLDGYAESGEYKGRQINIVYKAYYDIAGIVTSVRDYWGFGAYDTLAPRDICLIWGDLAARYPSPDMEFHHDNRSCYSKLPIEYLDQSRTGAYGVTHYGSSQVSNNHLIPSTAEIRSKLMSFGVGDKVRIVGYLVKAYYDGIFLDSSMTRNDVIFNHTSTTCEIIYVTKAEKV